MIGSIHTSNTNITTTDRSAANNLLLKLSQQILLILSIVFFILSVAMTLGGCAALIISKNILFIFLSTVGGLVLGMGIILRHAFISKKNCA
ncbi:hypothetical protein [Chlamydia avium]|uniref:Membrane protein n=1 Tax=Chlamydia avium 10DC88 TaxID=1229831 RepID=W8JFY8_9CHLA|nr:hypothetical protein [Chlamydia avium]AHK63105.1 Putative membrane protein [Chlamydia avium 10DC88]